MCFQIIQWFSSFWFRRGGGCTGHQCFFFKWSNLFCSAIWRTIYWKSSNQHSQSINLLMLNTLICCRASWCQFNWTIITLSFYYIYMPRSTVILCKLNCKFIQWLLGLSIVLASLFSGPPSFIYPWIGPVCFSLFFLEFKESPINSTPTNAPDFFTTGGRENLLPHPLLPLNPKQPGPSFFSCYQWSLL